VVTFDAKFSTQVPGTIMVLRGLHLLTEFAETRPQCLAPLAAWRNEIEEADWGDADDLAASDLVARHDDAANSVLFTVVPSMCLVQTTVNFRRRLLLVTKAFCPAKVIRRRRAA
jgi:mRNA-degrading endonuclease HigB of HigAB toxin-antitoxin module